METFSWLGRNINLNLISIYLSLFLAPLYVQHQLFKKRRSAEKEEPPCLKVRLMHSSSMWARIFKLPRSPRIDSKESNSAGQCSLAGRYYDPIPTGFLAPNKLFKNSSSDAFIRKAARFFLNEKQTTFDAVLTPRPCEKGSSRTSWYCARPLGTFPVTMRLTNKRHSADWPMARSAQLKNHRAHTQPSTLPWGVISSRLGRGFCSCTVGERWGGGGRKQCVGGGNICVTVAGSSLESTRCYPCSVLRGRQLAGPLTLLLLYAHLGQVSGHPILGN